MTTPAVRDVSAKGPRFFDLPRELRDIVYDMAYGERRTARVISRRTAEAEARVQGKAVAFSESSVSHLLINKQFFTEATELWTANKVFEFKMFWDIRFCLGDIHSMGQQVLQHITELVCLGGLLDRTAGSFFAERFPGLKRVTQYISPWRLDKVLTDEQLVGLPEVVGLLEVRGLESLTVLIKHFGLAIAQQEDIEKENMARLQKLVTEAVTQPQGSSFEKIVIPTLDEALKSMRAAKELDKHLAARYGPGHRFDRRRGSFLYG